MNRGLLCGHQCVPYLSDREPVMFHGGDTHDLAPVLLTFRKEV